MAKQNKEREEGSTTKGCMHDSCCHPLPPPLLSA